MIAYNHRSLDQLLINDESAAALHKQLISKEEFTAIKQAHPVDLYRPNLFIRIGLFLATSMITSTSFGLLMLIFGSAAPMEIIFPFFSILIYVALEMLIRKKRHFRSGVDDAFLWNSLGFMLAAFALTSRNISDLGWAILYFMLSFYATIRFGNRITTAIMLISFFSVIFYIMVPFGAIVKSILPFVIMILSFIIYLTAKKNKHRYSFRHYASCLLVIEVLSLVTMYASVNYFVVREVSNEIFHLNLPDGATITGGWFFWTATLLIPPVCLIRSLQKKDVVLLRTGLLLLAASIFTIRYYYVVAPIEIVMTAGGIVLIVLMYVVTKLFKMPKAGITTQEMDYPEWPGINHLEGLVVSETFQQTPVDSSRENFQFGGGTTGGAGASGEY